MRRIGRVNLSLQGASRNVPAIMHPIPTDRVDAPVNFLDRFRKIAAPRGYSQYTTAGSPPPAALFAGAGMKDKASGPILQLFKAADPSQVISLTERLLESRGGLLFDGYKSDAPEGWRSTVNKTAV